MSIMNIIESNKCLCTCCMEEHEVKTVAVNEKATYKNTRVEYDATYLYCDKADELYMNEQQMQNNDIRLKNAYRKLEGLLTSDDIVTIRSNYEISQGDLCILLGWGGKTITRYESSQVQDRAHDTILKKLGKDPEWFLELLSDSKKNLSERAYQKYWKVANSLYDEKKDLYLRKTIEAGYAKFKDNLLYSGNSILSLDKVVDVVRYFASSSYVKGLYKVKLMKLMWYADALSYIRRGCSITGLVYQSLPMGAVPVEHDSIICLKGIPCEEIDIGDNTAYHFSIEEEIVFSTFNHDELQILEFVAKKLGRMKTDEIVAFMHEEYAYKNTEPGHIISFEDVNDLQI